MKKVIIILLLILTCSNFIKATEQTPDYLYYQNKKLTLYTNWAYPSPLQTYYQQNNLDYPFQFGSTANYRGHIATWEIIENKLYLKEIKVGDNTSTPQQYNINSKNKKTNRNNAVFADWFSGMITSYSGNQSYYFYVRNGIVKDSEIITENDFKLINGITKKSFTDYELMNKFVMLVLNQNYISYYFRLNEEDNISINGQKGCFNNKLGHSPLLEFYSNDHMKFPYNWENLDKSGAPNCSWSVVNNRIYLDKVQLYSGTGFYEIKKDNVELKSLFNEKVQSNKVFADWLNGV